MIFATVFGSVFGFLLGGAVFLIGQRLTRRAPAPRRPQSSLVAYHVGFEPVPIELHRYTEDDR